MKKNLLFIIPSLSAGGGEKSLVNLLSLIDYNLYNVDLFLLNQQGIFLEYLPKEVKVLPLPETYKVFTLPIYNSLTKLLTKGKVTLGINRILYSLRNRYIKNQSIREQQNWKYLAKSLDELDGQYDVAIGFLEKTATYFCIDKVKAEKKIGWVHIDYKRLGMDQTFDSKYFNRLSHLITVSEECANILKDLFPNEINKINVIYNIVSPTIINDMANQEKNFVYDKTKEEINLLSIGRLNYQKGFEIAIEACRILVGKGYNIRWSVIGEGEEREKLTKLIKSYNLESNFSLLGLKSNPYPYIKQADIYAQTSRFEGKSIAIDEAKILNKPIIVTNYSTAKDQIDDGVTGLIVDMDSNSVADGIERLIKDSSLSKNLITNLSNLKLGTEDEINKFYKIL